MMMKKYFYSALIFLLTCSSATAQRIFPGLGGQRAGITVFQFLKIGVTPRAEGMGGSFVAISDDASALYWNPAGAVRSGANELMFANTQWFADIGLNYGAYLHHLTDQDAIGVSVTSLQTGDMERTTVLAPSGTGAYFSYQDLAVGVTYSRAMTDQFSFGVTAKYVRESIAELAMQEVMIDLGAFYYTGYANSRFGITLSNFGGTTKPEGIATSIGLGEVSDFQEFSPPTVFRMAFAFEPYQSETYRMTMSVQLNHPNDNAENLSLGGEFAWTETVFLRGGYKINVEEQQMPSYGIGVRIPVEYTTIRFDYGSANFGTLGNTHRFSVSFTL
ncbi:MAG: PorV/PorQ family protein [Bacteroidota bacterium]